MAMLESVDPALLAVRDEILLHHQFAREVACVASLLEFGLQQAFRLPEKRSLDEEVIRDTIQAELDNATSLFEAKPGYVSYMAELALTAGARSTDGVSEKFERGSGSSTIALAALPDSLQTFVGAFGSSPEEVANLLVGESDRCRQSLRTFCFPHLPDGELYRGMSTAIDLEVAAALEWSRVNLSPYHDTPPKQPRPVAKTASARCKKISAIGYLSAHHRSEGPQDALTNQQIAAGAEVSPTTVTRALQRVFGPEGLSAYIAACERGDVADKLAQYNGDGLAFGTTDPTALDSRDAQPISG